MATFVVLSVVSLASQSLQGLCHLFDAKCSSQLSLRVGESGVRGVFAEETVKPGTNVLQIPVGACLRDDAANLQSDEWAVRLASCFLELKKNEKKSKAQQAWLALLPTDLKESLPVHWDESLVRRCLSTGLDLAVDRSYFARAEALYQLQTHSSEPECQYALDIVQTRCCRVEPGIRLLAPIFDLLNHGGDQSNAEFFRDDDTLVVRTTETVEAGFEVLIDYGESARPAWKCLLNYGFVPSDDGRIELSFDGVEYSLGANSIPYELVESISFKIGQAEVDLTPAVRTVLAECATGMAGGNVRDDQEESTSRPEQLAKDLRLSRRLALLAFADGMRECQDA